MRFLDVKREVFIIQGQHVEITMWDVYFLFGLLILGVVGDLVPNLSRGETLEELYERHCYGTAYVHGSHILFCDIEDPSTRALAVMVLCLFYS